MSILDDVKKYLPPSPVPQSPKSAEAEDGVDEYFLAGTTHPHDHENVEKVTDECLVKHGEARLDRDGVTSEKHRFNGGSTAEAKPEISTKGEVQENAEIIRKPSFMPLTDADWFWLQKRLEAPSLLYSSDLVGIRLARHYAEGGEAVGYRHPQAFMDTDGIPARFAESNQALRAGLAICKFPSGIVTVRTDAGGHDFWDVTGRGMELFRRLSDGLEDYTGELWFISAMRGDVMPKKPKHGGR